MREIRHHKIEGYEDGLTLREVGDARTMPNL